MKILAPIGQPVPDWVLELAEAEPFKGEDVMGEYSSHPDYFNPEWIWEEVLTDKFVVDTRKEWAGVFRLRFTSLFLENLWTFPKEFRGDLAILAEKYQKAMEIIELINKHDAIRNLLRCFEGTSNQREQELMTSLRDYQRVLDEEYFSFKEFFGLR